jgi:hypothetical protein
MRCSSLVSKQTTSSSAAVNVLIYFTLVMLLSRGEQSVASYSALALGYVTEDQFDQWVRPENVVGKTIVAKARKMGSSTSWSNLSVTWTPSRLRVRVPSALRALAANYFKR